eukprot:g11827.t1
MRCGCGNVFCQSRCPSCRRWNTFNGEAQGGRTRTCGFCGCKFHEAFCPGCGSWGVWEGKKGCRSLSCDCGGLFYEISCQSCGMWGSVKGRHADDNNSLRCGTCGSDSHEAFCPACLQWDSYPGSKGESTLTCNSPRCRGRQGGETTKFFQVYCETCECWRSVLGEKDAVGGASVRCEGCKSNLRGSTCPACGNWDQLLVGRPHQHQAFRRKATRFHQKQPPAEGSDSGTPGASEEEGGTMLLVRPRPTCTSCGHQPPASPGADEPPGSEEGLPSSGAVRLAGVAHEDAEAVEPVTAPTAGPTATPAAPTGTPTAGGGIVEDGGLRVRQGPRTAVETEASPPPPLEADEDPAARDNSATPATLRNGKISPGQTPGKIAERAEGAEPRGGGGTEMNGSEERGAPRKAFASAPVHGTNPNTGATGSSDVGGSRHKRAPQGGAASSGDLENNDGKTANKINRRGDRRVGAPSSASSTASAGDDDAAVGGDGEQPSVRPMPDRRVPPGVRGDNEAQLPAAPVPSEGNAAAPRAVQPPPRSTLRRRGGRRPFVPRHPPPSSSPPVVASASDWGAAEADEPAGVKVRTALKAEVGDGQGMDGREGGLAPPAAVPVALLSAEGAEAAEEYGGKNAAASRRHHRAESGRPASGNHGNGGRRRRKKRLGSRSSSSSPSPRPFLSSKPVATPTTSGSPIPGGGKGLPVSGGHPPTRTPGSDGDDGANSCRGTFAAVPRESSPPPPPGIRIGGREEGGEADGPGRRGTGAKEMVHLAFCSRCQEYQSWRAPLSSGGWRRRIESASSGSPGARKNCTECGDLYSNVSYYPAR